MRNKIDQSDLKTTGDVTPEIFRQMMEASAKVIFSQRDKLCELDGAIGDGDHGITMEIGWKSVIEALSKVDTGATISELCDIAGKAFLDSVGASVGPLYASAFENASEALSDRLNLDAVSVVVLIEAMTNGIAQRGGAKPGDKTMMDAWYLAAVKARERLNVQGSAKDCLKAAALGAQSGADATKGMMSQLGRSKKLGQRTVGHVDPGATSAVFIISAWLDAL